MDDQSKDLLRGWRAELQAAGRAPGTITLRLSHARRLVEHSGVPVSSLTREHIVAWLANSKWSPAARRSAATSVRQFSKWLAVGGILGEDIARDLPSTTVPRAVPKPIPDAYIADAMRARDMRVALAVEIMATCGLRRDECARVRAADVEPIGQGWQLRVQGKGGHVRLVPLPSGLARRLKARGGWIFPGQVDGHISAAWLGKLIRKYLPGEWTPHKIRHRFASVAYHGGHDLRAVQVLLGHASVATTQIYVGLDDEATRVAAQAAWHIAA